VPSTKPSSLDPGPTH